MSSDSEDLEIELEDDHFHFLVSNLLGHDPIHDFNEAHDFIQKIKKEPSKTSEIKDELLELYKLIKKYELKSIVKYGGADDDSDDEIPSSTISQSEIEYQTDKRRIEHLIEDNGLYILYFIGFLSEEKINELKRNETDRNLIYLLMNEVFENILGFTLPGSSGQSSSTQSGGMPPSINQNQQLLNSGFIDNKRPGEKLDSKKRYTFSLTGETMGLGEAKEFLNKRKAATKIQSNQRIRSSKELLNKTRKAKAATRIQSSQRMRSSKQLYKTKKLEKIKEKIKQAKTKKIARKFTQTLKSKVETRKAEKPKTKKEIEDEIITLMIHDKLNSKYIIIDQLTTDIVALELNKKFQEQEKIRLEEEEGLKEGDDEWEEINEKIEELEIEIEENNDAIEKIKAPVITLILELKDLIKDERTDDEIFETFRTKVQEKLEEIKKSTTKEIPNEIVKLFALLGKNINKNIQGTFTTKQSELFDKIITTGGWNEKGGGNIDKNLFNFFNEMLKSKSQTMEEIIKEEDKENKFIINNSAIVSANSYRKNVLGSFSSVIDPAPKVYGGVIEKERVETGDMKVIFTNKDKTYSYELEVKYRPDEEKKQYTVHLKIEFKLPLSKDKDIIDGSISTAVIMNDAISVKNTLSAASNYHFTLTILVEKIRQMKLFEWDKLLDDKIFILSFVTSYHKKALGDFIQELNAILKYSGYKYKDSNPIYKDELNIIQFKKTSKGKEEDGNKFRVYASNDRPSACRYLFLKEVLSEKDRNTKSFGGYYFNRPSKETNLFDNYFLI